MTQTTTDDARSEQSDMVVKDLVDAYPPQESRRGKLLISPIFRYFIAAGFVLLAALLASSLHRLLDSRYVFVPFFLAVLLSTYWGGWRPGVVAMILSAPAGYLLFTEFHSWLGPNDPDFSLRLLAFASVSAVAISLNEMQRRGQHKAELLVQQLQQEVARHQQTERKLATSEESYRSLFENNMDAVFTLNLEGYFVTANPSALKLSGYSLVELQQLRFTALCPLEEQAEALRHFGLAVRGTPEPFFEYRIITKEGRLLDLLFTGGPVKSKGQIVGVFAIASDNTEQNRARMQVAAFSQMGQKLSSVTSPVEAGRILGDVAEELFGWDSFSLNLYSLETSKADYVLNVDTFDGEKIEILPFQSTPGIPPLARRVMANGAELVLDSSGLSSDLAPYGGSMGRFASMMHAPIRDHEKTIGVLSVRNRQPEAYGEADLKTLLALADYCGGALQRIRAEDRLRQHAEEYRAMFDSDGSSRWQVDPHTMRFLRVNPKFCEMTGYSEDELLEKTFLDITHPEDREPSERFHRLAMAGKLNEFRLEKRYVHKDNSIRWADLSVTMLRDAKGTPYCAISSAIDITARVQAEAALRESENRFTSFMQNLSASAWMKDTQGRYVYVNPRGTEEIGTSSEAILGRTDDELFPPETAKMFAANDREVLNSGTSIQNVQSFTNKEGQRYLVANIFPIHDKNGKPALVAGIAVDVTEQKIAEEALALSNLRLSVIARVTNAVVGNKPLAEQMLNVAETVRTAYGVTACIIRELDGEDMSLLTSAGIDPRHLSPRTALRYGIGKEILKRRGPLFIPDLTEYQSGPGAKRDPPLKPLPFVSYAGAPLMVQDRIIGVMGLYTVERMKDFKEMDLQQLQIIANHIAVAIANARLYEKVTRQKSDLEQQVRERQLAEQEIYKLNEELELRVEERTRQLQLTNAELEAFAYSVSHDLRAPLRSVGGFGEALKDEYEDRLDAQGREYLNRVIDSSRDMDQLIDAMLHLSRLTRMDMKRQPVNLSALAESIISQLREAEPRRRVEVRITPNLIAPADARLLRIVLENLLNNAWKFTGRTRMPLIEFGMLSRPEGPAYFVRDNGAGFDMEFAGKLFGAFQRLHSTSEFPGHGIGLATVQRIIHRHGGRTWAEGKIDHGATFHFTLPS